MENTGEVMTAGVSVPVQTNIIEPVFEPEFEFDAPNPEAEFEETVFDKPQMPELFSENSDIDPFPLEGDGEEVHMNEIDGTEEEDIMEFEEDEIKNVRQELEKEQLDKAVPKEVFSNEEFEILSIILMQLFSELERLKKENEKSFLEILIMAMGWLMKEMFLPEEEQKKKEQKTNQNRTIISMNTDRIKEIKKIFLKRQEALNAQAVESFTA